MLMIVDDHVGSNWYLYFVLPISIYILIMFHYVPCHGSHLVVASNLQSTAPTADLKC